MRKIRILTVIILITFSFFFKNHAQTDFKYNPLNKEDPVQFYGSYIIYNGDSILLGPRSFFIDAQLSDQLVSNYPYVFNSINRAAEHLTDGSEIDPMVLHIAPYVYWIDDPDDPAVRVPDKFHTPYGLVIECEWLKFHGLSKDARNVVLACNRGQTMGSRGNFTMFRFFGDGTASENLTFGNYCNVDLEYPLKPELSREKRGSAIVQAQLIHCDGDKIIARNTRFISRLNLCPFFGGKRVLFDSCHFESTDDALCGTGVYLNSTLDFYNAKPFYRTTGTGAVFLGCDIRSYTIGPQYFTKANGQLAVVDTRINSSTVSYLGWRDVVPPQMRNYQYNAFFNEEPVLISKEDPQSTVTMKGKSLLNAYLFRYAGELVYNTYNLLCGDDDWDPMGIKQKVLEAEENNRESYTMLPVQLTIEPEDLSLETGKNSAILDAKIFRFGNFPVNNEVVSWRADPESSEYVRLKSIGNGQKCEVIPQNNGDHPRKVILLASTSSGLQAASVLHILPSKLPPPGFSSLPEIKGPEKGKLSVEYDIDMRFEDRSLVSWYRCEDAEGKDAVEVAVSRMEKPLKEYELGPGDVGYYIMTSVAPKHIRCDAGKKVFDITAKPISEEDVPAGNHILIEDFKNLSAKDQPLVKPGFWTLESFEPVINGRLRPSDKNKDAWYYGKIINGDVNETGFMQAQNASLRYTPEGQSFGDMKINLRLTPFKYEGQGFAIAGNYMDVLIKSDNKSITGYGLRLIRTTKYHDAVDFYFIRYENGKVSRISEPVSSTCYRPDVTITLEVKGNRIIAHAESQAEYQVLPGRPEVVTEVDMESEINPNPYGGFAMHYAGGAPTIIKEIKIEWEK